MSPLFLCRKKGIIKKNGSRFSDPAAVLQIFMKKFATFFVLIPVLIVFVTIKRLHCYDTGAGVNPVPAFLRSGRTQGLFRSPVCLLHPADGSWHQQQRV